MNSENKIKVGITHGDYNGIGYEVILKALEDERMLELMTPVVYGSPKLFNATRKSLNMSQLSYAERKSAAEAADNEITVVNVVEGDPVPEPGKSTPEAGKAALAALQRAVDDLKSGAIDVLVTAPINKHNIQSDQFHFAGHTEFLEEKLGGEGDKALMLLVDGKLRVALVTGHIPVAKVGESITTELILEKLDVLNKSLKRDFTIVRPLIAVLALNPHSGDNGLLGDEEQNIIIPAIKEANEKGIMAFGPYSADGFFGSGLHTRFDAVLAMYHDQGLAPFKALGMDAGVNFTAGLPYVRTSPDHGTGYDIAGKGEASADSMREAIYAAIDIFRRRDTHDTVTANPLRKHYHERNKHDNTIVDLSE